MVLGTKSVRQTIGCENHKSVYTLWHDFQIKFEHFAYILISLHSTHYHLFLLMFHVMKSRHMARHTVVQWTVDITAYDLKITIPHLFYMPLELNKAEKAELLRSLKAIKTNHIDYLNKEVDKVSKSCEKSVLRRLRKVSMTAQPLKIADVLEMERHETPTIPKLKSEQNTTWMWNRICWLINMLL